MIRQILLIMLTLLLSLNLKANEQHPGGNDLKGASPSDFNIEIGELNEQLLTFDYFTPFDGVVRVFLLDESGKELWRNQYNAKQGDHTLKLNATRLTPGRSYQFVFRYKFEERAKRVNLPASRG